MRLQYFDYTEESLWKLCIIRSKNCQRECPLQLEVGNSKFASLVLQAEVILIQV